MREDSRICVQVRFYTPRSLLSKAEEVHGIAVAESTARGSPLYRLVAISSYIVAASAKPALPRRKKIKGG